MLSLRGYLGYSKYASIVSNFISQMSGSMKCFYMTNTKGLCWLQLHKKDITNILLIVFTIVGVDIVNV